MQINGKKRQIKKRKTNTHRYCIWSINLLKISNVISVGTTIPAKNARRIDIHLLLRAIIPFIAACTMSRTTIWSSSSSSCWGKPGQRDWRWKPSQWNWHLNKVKRSTRFKTINICSFRLETDCCLLVFSSFYNLTK